MWICGNCVWVWVCVFVIGVDVCVFYRMIVGFNGHNLPFIEAIKCGDSCPHKINKGSRCVAGHLLCVA